MASGALACDTTGRIPNCEPGTAGRNTAPSLGSPADSDWDAPSSGTAGPIAAWEPGTAGRNTAPCETLAFSVAAVMFTEDSASAACLAALTRLCLAYLFSTKPGRWGFAQMHATLQQPSHLRGASDPQLQFEKGDADASTDGPWRPPPYAEHPSARTVSPSQSCFWFASATTSHVDLCD